MARAHRLSILGSSLGHCWMAWADVLLVVLSGLSPRNTAWHQVTCRDIIPEDELVLHHPLSFRWRMGFESCLRPLQTFFLYLGKVLDVLPARGCLGRNAILKAIRGDPDLITTFPSPRTASYLASCLQLHRVKCDSDMHCPGHILH